VTLDLSMVCLHIHHVQSCQDATEQPADRWHVELLARLGEGQPSEALVAHGEVLLVDLFGADPYGSLGRFDTHVRQVRDILFDAETRELDESFCGRLEILGDRLMIFTELSIAPEWRGHGLAPLIVRQVIRKMAHSSVAVVFAPRGHLLDGRDVGEVDRDQLLDCGLPFDLFHGGLYYLNTAEEDVRSGAMGTVRLGPRLSSGL
jgi:GNAT superfamily N-acetyltransferase